MPVKVVNLVKKGKELLLWPAVFGRDEPQLINTGTHSICITQDPLAPIIPTAHYGPYIIVIII